MGALQYFRDLSFADVTARMLTVAYGANAGEFFRDMRVSV
jgi:hypothetical protein